MWYRFRLQVSIKLCQYSECMKRHEISASQNMQFTEFSIQAPVFASKSPVKENLLTAGNYYFEINACITQNLNDSVISIL
jgi:hypothetical protein